MDDAAFGDEPDGWRSRVEAILKANVYRRVNGRVAAHRTVEHNTTVIFCAFDTWHNKLNHKIKIPQKLTDRHVQVLVRYWYEEGKAASTMNNDLSVLRKFFGWMGKKGIVRSLKEYLPDAPADRIERRNMAATGNRSKSWSANGIDVEQKLQEAFALDERFGIILAMQFAFGYRRKETISIRPWINDLRPLGQNAFMMYERDGTKGGRQRLIRLEFPFQVWALDYAKSRISKRAHLGWQKTRRGENATLEYSLERYKEYMKKLGICRKDVFVTGHGGRAEYAENCALLRGFVPVPASLGGKANQMPREDLEILEKQVSENLGHSRARITRDSYYGTPDKAEPQAASSEQVEGSGSGTPGGVADNASQRPPVGTAISLEERLAAACEPPKGFLDLATSYYRTMPAGRVRPDPSKPPVPGVGRFAAKAISEKAKAEPVKRKGGVRSRPYDEMSVGCVCHSG
ncbi:hypothetical protein PPGU19_097440 (plasmid) [Paraburkholderia sp. PGU19]|uniref:phage integrase N-terminal domain-containing protein n=1 Tax=Paraburkholderia sp. PGU19 TaxID=2735434 RepID=UPI0015DAF710|nr:phage integrase N-terminal domain-containing protein [Paraburkholderia sp. PGU19]BCG05176.1 hypothetical protein PPGU19_097440 [Paraburkholderia sp. PGU19]